LLDVLTGLLGLILVLVLDFRTGIKFDLRWFFMAGASVCFVLGFLRHEKEPDHSAPATSWTPNSWSKPVLIISGFSVPVLVLLLAGMSFGGTGIWVAFLFLCIHLDCLRGYGAGGYGCMRVAKATGWFLFLPLGCIFVASMWLLPTVMGKLSGRHLNNPAPDFSLSTDSGKAVTLTELTGKVVVLAFGATWCEPCWQELPRVEKVSAFYKDNRGVVFWAVNARAGGDTDDLARAFAKRMRLHLPIAYSENATALSLGVEGYPTLILLDAGGHIRFIHDGYDGSERLESNLFREIANLLN
jgi:thiol-disulfide isomerase/thioredoxin